MVVIVAAPRPTVPFRGTHPAVHSAIFPFHGLRHYSCKREERKPRIAPAGRGSSRRRTVRPKRPVDWARSGSDGARRVQKARRKRQSSSLLRSASVSLRKGATVICKGVEEAMEHVQFRSATFG